MTFLANIRSRFGALRSQGEMLAGVAQAYRASEGARSAGELDEAIARLTKGASPAFDLSTRSGRAVSVRQLEELFFEIVSGFSPALFLEAGAKAADASLRARKLLPRATVVAYEANPYTHERFSKKRDYEAEGVDYRNLALGSSPSEVTFNVRKTDDGQPSADGQGSLLKNIEYEPGHIQVTGEATTIDATLREFDADDCILWVDVEGASREVLGGADRALARASAIFIEVEDREYWDSQWLSQRVLLELNHAGLVPVARDYQSRYQWNVVCVRREMLWSPLFLRPFLAYCSRLVRLQAKLRTSPSPS